MARIVGAAKPATGLSEAREAAEAIAQPRIACFLVGLFPELVEGGQTNQKATQNKK